MNKIRPTVLLPSVVAILMSLILGVSTMARRASARRKLPTVPAQSVSAPAAQGILAASTHSSSRACPGDPTLPPNLCDAYVYISQDVGGDVDTAAVAADRRGQVAANVAMWEGPTVAQRNFGIAPFDTLYQVGTRYALTEDGRLYAGVVSASSAARRRMPDADVECLGLLTTSSADTITLKDTLLWHLLASEYHRIAQYIAGDHSLDDDPLLTNNYGNNLYVLHSALTLYNPRRFPNADQADLLWSPLGEQLIPYNGEVKRRFELHYTGKKHAFLYIAPRSGNPYEETNVGTECRLAPESVEWIRERAHQLDRYPSFVELRASVRSNWRYCQGHISMVYAGKAMLATDAAEYPPSGDNPPPELLILPEGVSMGIPSKVQRDPRLLGAYEETREVMVDRNLSIEERQNALTVIQRTTGEEALAQTLRMMPVYSREDQRFYTFSGYIQKALAQEGSPMQRDPVGASIRIFFDPSPETIREMMGQHEGE